MIDEILFFACGIIAGTFVYFMGYRAGRRATAKEHRDAKGRFTKAQ